MSDRQTKLDATMGSVSPARLEQTRADMEFEIERQKLAAPQLPTMTDDGSVPPVSARMRQLDLIQDVQLILVDRYRYASRLIIAAMVLGVIAFAGLLWKNFDLQERIAHMQEAQEALLERGFQIERKADETNQKVDETKAKIDETNQKVDQAVDAAPKIEIDAKGQPKVVLPVSKSAVPLSSVKKPVQLPVEPKRN